MESTQGNIMAASDQHIMTINAPPSKLPKSDSFGLTFKYQDVHSGIKICCNGICWIVSSTAATTGHKISWIFLGIMVIVTVLLGAIVDEKKRYHWHIGSLAFRIISVNLAVFVFFHSAGERTVAYSTTHITFWIIIFIASIISSILGLIFVESLKTLCWIIIWHHIKEMSIQEHLEGEPQKLEDMQPEQDHISAPRHKCISTYRWVMRHRINKVFLGIVLMAFVTAMITDNLVTQILFGIMVTTTGLFGLLVHRIKRHDWCIVFLMLCVISANLLVFLVRPSDGANDTHDQRLKFLVNAIISANLTDFLMNRSGRECLQRYDHTSDDPDNYWTTFFVITLIFAILVAVFLIS